MLAMIPHDRKDIDREIEKYFYRDNNPKHGAVFVAQVLGIREARW